MFRFRLRLRGKIRAKSEILRANLIFLSVLATWRWFLGNPLMKLLQNHHRTQTAAEGFAAILLPGKAGENWGGYRVL